MLGSFEGFAVLQDNDDIYLALRKNGGIYGNGCIVNINVKDTIDELEQFAGVRFTGAETYINENNETRFILNKPTGIHAYIQDGVYKIVITNSKGGVNDTGNVLLIDLETKVVEKILLKGDELQNLTSIQQAQPAFRYGGNDCWWVLDSEKGLMMYDCRTSTAVLVGYLFNSGEFGSNFASAFEFKGESLLIVFKYGGVNNRGSLIAYKFENIIDEIVNEYNEGSYFELIKPFSESLLSRISVDKVVLDGSEYAVQSEYCLDHPTCMTTLNLNLSESNNNITTAISNSKDGVGYLALFSKA